MTIDCASGVASRPYAYRARFTCSIHMGHQHFGFVPWAIRQWLRLHRQCNLPPLRSVDSFLVETLILTFSIEESKLCCKQMNGNGSCLLLSVRFSSKRSNNRERGPERQQRHCCEDTASSSRINQIESSTSRTEGQTLSLKESQNRRFGGYLFVIGKDSNVISNYSTNAVESVPANCAKFSRRTLSPAGHWIGMKRK